MLSEVLLLAVLAGVAESEISNFINNEFSEDENRQYIKDEMVLSNDNRNSANHFSEPLPGDPRLDYPTYTEIPRTSFSCQGKVNWHYYADIDTECQVFHICQSEYSKVSFVCPIGSIFNQKHLVCDWWYNFDCNDAERLYKLSNDFEQEISTVVEDGEGFDLSLASSGENSHPAKTKPNMVENLPVDDERNIANVEYVKRNN